MEYNEDDVIADYYDGDDYSEGLGCPDAEE